jgi:hypothetical protein
MTLNKVSVRDISRITEEEKSTNDIQPAWKNPKGGQKLIAKTTPAKKILKKVEQFSVSHILYSKT